jgi:hypothetical protein
VIDFRLSFVAEHRAMKRVVIMLFQLLVTAAGLWYVFHEPQRRAQIADALRHADIRWVLLGWICYTAVEILATVRWQILLRIQGIYQLVAGWCKIVIVLRWNFLRVLEIIKAQRFEIRGAWSSKPQTWQADISALDFTASLRTDC